MKGIESLVAINVLVGDRLINKNNVTLLYYNNGDTPIIDAIKSDNAFIDLLKANNVFTIDNFGKASIALFDYHNNKCTNINEDIQNIIDISDTLYTKYIDTIISALFILVNPGMTYVSYRDSLPNLLSEKITTDILFNYIKSELSSKYNLHQKQIKYIINKLHDEISI